MACASWSMPNTTLRLSSASSSVVSTSKTSVAQSLNARGFPCCAVLARQSDFMAGESDLQSFSGMEEGIDGRVFMAVPKKGTSRTKTKIRRAVWKNKGRVAALKALSLGASILTQRGSFVFRDKDTEGLEEDGGDALEE